MGALLDIFAESPGVRVDLTTRPNADVVTYVAFVRKWTSAGAIPEATWMPATLEAGGNSLVLGNERGYDIILQAVIRDNGTAEIVPDLRISDSIGTRYTKTISLPNSEGPVVQRGWKIVLV